MVDPRPPCPVCTLGGRLDDARVTVTDDNGAVVVVVRDVPARVCDACGIRNYSLQVARRLEEIADAHQDRAALGCAVLYFGAATAGDQDGAAAGAPAVDPLIPVTGVRVVARYIVEVTFADGAVKVVDLEPYLWGEAFQSLVEDYGHFCAVTIDEVGATICWPNGADLSPRTLYAEGRAAVPGPQTTVALPADIHQIDETGYVWAMLEEAYHPERVQPGRLVVAGDADEPFSARVVDIVPGDAEGTHIVHLDLEVDTDN